MDEQVTWKQVPWLLAIGVVLFFAFGGAMHLDQVREESQPPTGCCCE